MEGGSGWGLEMMDTLMIERRSYDDPPSYLFTISIARIDTLVARIYLDLFLAVALETSLDSQLTRQVGDYEYARGGS